MKVTFLEKDEELQKVLEGKQIPRFVRMIFVPAGKSEKDIVVTEKEVVKEIGIHNKNILSSSGTDFVLFDMFSPVYVLREVASSEQRTLIKFTVYQKN